MYQITPGNTRDRKRDPVPSRLIAIQVVVIRVAIYAPFSQESLELQSAVYRVTTFCQRL